MPPVTTSSQDTAVPLNIPDYDATVPSSTSGDDATTPVITTGHNATIHRPTENPLPIYEGEDVAQIQSEQARVEEAERVRQYDTRIANFCATNRDLISPALERKLHNARYLPEDNPSDISATYRRGAYDVELFEFRRLQTAYERLVLFGTYVSRQTNLDILLEIWRRKHLINRPEKAVPQAVLRRKEKEMDSP